MPSPLLRYLPNALTVSRILLAPYLVLSAWSGSVGAYTALVLIILFLTDFLDGWIARRFQLSSELGARLDSLADSIAYWCLGACLWMTQSSVWGMRGSIILLIVIQMINWGFCLCKFGQITSYHSTIAKWSAPVIYLGVIVLLAAHCPWIYWLAVAMAVISNVEDMVITALLEKPATNVKNIARALELRRSKMTI